MAQKLNIYNDYWIEMLFQNRNQKYGAFQLRKENGLRHLYGILIALGIFLTVLWAPNLYKKDSDKIIEKTGEVILTIFTIDRPDAPKEIVIDKPMPKLKQTIMFTPPRITNEPFDETKEMKTQQDVIESGSAISLFDVPVGSDDGEDLVNVINNQIVEKPNINDTPLEFAAQMPEFPGGNAALGTFLRNSLKYPIIAQEAGIAGMVLISFVVNRDGSISNIRVARGVHPSLDNEAIRVVQSMPDWIPGKQNGETVRVYHTVPINFVLK